MGQMSHRAARGFVVMLAFAGASVAALSAEAAQRWQMLDKDSRLGFVFLLQGQPMEGHFQRFAADILFDPTDLTAAHVAVDIDLASVRAGDGERDAMLADKDWFHVKAHPVARFETTGFEALGEGRYRAQARLQIKGVSQDVALPFSLTITDDVAHVVGELHFQRTQFDVGAGGWAKGDVVGLPVVVKVDIKARRGDAVPAP